MRSHRAKSLIALGNSFQLQREDKCEGRKLFRAKAPRISPAGDVRSGGMSGIERPRGLLLAVLGHLRGIRLVGLAARSQILARDVVLARPAVVAVLTDPRLLANGLSHGLHR